MFLYKCSNIVNLLCRCSFRWYRLHLAISLGTIVFRVVWGGEVACEEEEIDNEPENQSTRVILSKEKKINNIKGKENRK